MSEAGFKADYAAPDTAPRVVRIGALEVFPDEFIATYAGREIQLNHKEFRLLAVFVTHPGRLLRREFIAERAWDGDAPGRSVDIAVSRLRKKLPPGAIKTIVRVGYRFVL
jgi:Response regulators consisting of a CheY-like receiver domain and a winged-helix DNA-binding domain